jgi:serine/threonine protein phosphatase PrpC
MLNGERLVIAMIADGHGGKEASPHCNAMVVDELLEVLKVPDGLHVRAAGTHAFLKAHEEVLAMMGTTAGSTLSVIVLDATRAELTVLHCGDSVTRLIPRCSAAMGLCEDHRPESSESERHRPESSESERHRPESSESERHRPESSESEHARVRAMGGKVARAMGRHGRPSGPVRLWPGGVALARTERSPPFPAVANSSHLNSE